ncbi:MAG: lipid-A-disaccharide synthase [Candidatus Omnitrophica bacterium]|nr:lipid-A-disaccharide synthase [Candidatus Omnitrophota bacterium]
MEILHKIAIVSGEVSGDQYAHLLALQLRKTIPHIEIVGIGASGLERSGIRIIAENPLSGTFGVSSVVRNLKQHAAFLNACVSAIRKENPDLIIFIDNPGFNLNLAKRLSGFRKIYYIPPKVWAHNYQRIFLIRQLFESVIVIFPFEKMLYEREGVPAYFFGHPVVDLIDNAGTDQEFFRKTEIDKQDSIVGLFPGSRKEEVIHILPLLVQAGKLIQKNYRVSFVVSCANEKLFPVEKEILESKKLDWPIWVGSAHAIAGRSHVALAASGTMNLELALLGIPMIVFYRMAGINYFLARIIVQLSYVSPVNIVYGKKIVEEFIQNVNWCRFQRVFSELFEESSEKRKAQIEEFKNMKQQLGGEKVSEKIASFISQKIEDENS